jgi:hypothetical protein
MSTQTKKSDSLYNPAYPRHILNDNPHERLTEISEQDRQDAAERLSELIQDAHSEIFGREE